MSFVESTSPGSISIGLIPRDELWEVQRALLFYRRDKLGGYEFSVRCRGSRRRWQIANDNIVVNIDGGFARFAGAYDINADLVSSCASMSARPSLTEITIDGRSVIATTPAGTTTMSGGMVNTEFRVIQVSRAVEAQISQGCLDILAETCPAIPDLPDDIDEVRDKFPIASISIGDNALSFSGKSNRFGYNSVTTTVSAITSGHGDISCLAKYLSHTLDVFWFDRKEPGVTIAFDPAGGEFIEFSTKAVNIVFRSTRVESGAKLK